MLAAHHACVFAVPAVVVPPCVGAGADVNALLTSLTLYIIQPDHATARTEVGSDDCYGRTAGGYRNNAVILFILVSTFEGQEC